MHNFRDFPNCNRADEIGALNINPRSKEGGIIMSEKHKQPKSKKILVDVYFVLFMFCIDVILVILTKVIEMNIDQTLT